MKKTDRTFIAICLAMVMVFAMCLSGCGSDTGAEKYADSEYVGTWAATTCEYDGVEMDTKDVVGEFTVTFNADGTCTVSIDDDPDNCEWEPKDKGPAITDGKDGFEFTDHDGILTVEYMDVKINFEKQ
ncbi:MAG: hypothetical protein Q4A65_06060 [Bacillota bacterium]|nr:hypothetical protein [Bacillota bacterium]